MVLLIDWLLTAGSWVGRTSLESSVLIALVAGILLWGRGQISARFRTMLWVVVGLRLMLPFSPESRWSVYNWVPRGAENSMVEAGAVTGLASVPVILPTQTFEVASPPSVVWSWSLGLAALWLVGVVVILGIAFVRQMTTAAWVRRLPTVANPELGALLQRSAAEAGVRRIPRLVESARVTGIAVFGGWRASHVILPVGFAERYSATEIHGIFLHELAHVRRGDLLWNWATLAIEAIHWFNPLVWWTGRQFLAERELVCDGFVLQRLPATDHRNYGEALLKTLEFGSRTMAPHPAFVPFLSRKSELQHRLVMIRKTPSINPFVQTLAAVLAIAGCAMTFTSALADDKQPSAEGGDRPAEGERQSPRDGERGSPREGGEMAAPTRRGGEIQLTVVADGVMMGDEKILLRDLRGKLETSNAARAMIYAEPQVSFQNVATVMNLLKSSGVPDVRVATTESEGRAMRGGGDGEGTPRSGPRDGDGAPRTGPRDGDGAPRTGPREGDGAPRTGPREGDGAPRAETGGMDDRKLAQLTRIYRVYDKDGNNGVSLEEWLAMKDGEMTADRRDREKGWFDQADANHDEKVSIGEWIDWKASQSNGRG